jgi:hypothetical protein
MIEPMSAIAIPPAAMKYFKLTGSVGGKKRASLYSKDQIREWGKLGGRPRKDAPKDSKKGGK